MGINCDLYLGGFHASSLLPKVYRIVMQSLPHMYIANDKLLKVHLLNNTLYTVILLPLHAASLMPENLQRCKINHGMCPVGHKDRSIALKMSFCRISCLCHFCGSYYGCC